MLDPFVEFLLGLHDSVGSGGFLAFTLGFSLLLCFWAIPWVTDHMVDSAAGLAGKYFGPKHRTLAINASTNNPELFLMLVSLAILRVGGVATPLGSNFANLYLMFLVAPFWVWFVCLLKGKKDERQGFIQLLKNEKGLVLWHFLAATGLFLASCLAFWFLTGRLPFGGGAESDGGTANAPRIQALLSAAAVCFGAILVMIFFDRRLKRNRPEVFQGIDDSGENASWLVFGLSTLGLVACSLIMNVIFLAWTETYSIALSAVLGAAVFTGLHYFAGALITSLPELTVATANYRKQRSPDLNTALGSASYSNFSNLAIAMVGCLIAALLITLGIKVGG